MMLTLSLLSDTTIQLERMLLLQPIITSLIAELLGLPVLRVKSFVTKGSNVAYNNSLIIPNLKST